MYKVFRSRALMAISVLATLGTLAGGVLLYVDIKLLQGRYSYVIALLILLLLLTVAATVYCQAQVLFQIIETDGDAWMRSARRGRPDVRIDRESMVGIAYEGFVLTVRSDAAEIVITPDCTGYKPLRKMLEGWRSSGRINPV